MGLIGLGLILLIVGFLLGLGVLWTIGIVLIIIGVILYLLPSGPSRGYWYGRW